MSGSRSSPSHARLTPLCLLALLAPGFLAGCTSPAAAPSIDPTSPAALIWSDPYPNLTIVVEYVEGFQPAKAALEELVETLGNVTDKQAIHLAEPTVRSNHTHDPDRVWSTDDLYDIHGMHNRAYDPEHEDTAFLFVNYLDGIYDADPQDWAWARGVDIHNDIFLFYEGVRANYTYGFEPRLGAENMERHVLMHELGHALGLVNCGIPMLTEREDPDSPCHSTEEESVMDAGIEDWRADIDAAIGRENTLAPLRFSAADLRDLEAFRMSSGR